MSEPILFEVMKSLDKPCPHCKEDIKWWVGTDTGEIVSIVCCVCNKEVPFRVVSRR